MNKRWRKSMIGIAMLVSMAGCSTSQPSGGTKPIIKNETIDHTQVKWEVFKGIHWSKTHKGLQVKAEKIAITKSIPNYEVDNQKTPAVKITFKLINNSSRPFLINPESAILNTSIEKSISPDEHISGYKKGEMRIKPGETKTGTLGYYLKPSTNVDKVNWVEWKVTATKYLVNDKRDKSYDTGKIKIRPN